MDLQVKKLEVDNSTTLRLNSLPSPYHLLPRHSQIAHPLPVKWEDYENLFQNVYFKSTL